MDICKHSPTEVRSSVINFWYNWLTLATEDVSLTHTSGSLNVCSGFEVFPSILTDKTIWKYFKPKYNQQHCSQKLTPFPAVSCQHLPSFPFHRRKVADCARTSSYLSWSPEKWTQQKIIMIFFRAIISTPAKTHFIFNIFGFFLRNSFQRFHYYRLSDLKRTG